MAVHDVDAAVSADRADLAPAEVEPNLADAPGLRVVPPLRRRALPDWLVGAAVGGGIVLGLAISVAGVFGVAVVIALVIVGQLSVGQVPRAWRRLRRH